MITDEQIDMINRMNFTTQKISLGNILAEISQRLDYLIELTSTSEVLKTESELSSINADDNNE